MGANRLSDPPGPTFERRDNCLVTLGRRRHIDNDENAERPNRLRNALIAHLAAPKRAGRVALMAGLSPDIVVANCSRLRRFGCMSPGIRHARNVRPRSVPDDHFPFAVF